MTNPWIREISSASTGVIDREPAPADDYRPARIDVVVRSGAQVLPPPGLVVEVVSTADGEPDALAAHGDRMAAAVPFEELSPDEQIAVGESNRDRLVEEGFPFVSEADLDLL